MRTAPFSYTRPDSVAEAVASVAAGGVPLAGGQALLQTMKLRKAAPAELVDLNRLDELRGVEQTPDGGLRIGALVRHADALRTAQLQQQLPWLMTAIGLIGDVQVRNRATIAGNVCWADPRANAAVALLACGASGVVADGTAPAGVPLTALFTGFRQTALDHRLLVALQVPPVPVGARGGYLELSRQRYGLALVSVAAVVSGDPVRHAAIAIGGLAPTPVRVPEVEAALLGRTLDDTSIDDAVAALPAAALDPVPDLHAPVAYRIRMGQVLVRRLLRQLHRSVPATTRNWQESR